VLCSFVKLLVQGSQHEFYHKALLFLDVGSSMLCSSDAELCVSEKIRIVQSTIGNLIAV
jgi:hypothetical protein